jgi:hypothetical protein
MPLFEEKTNQTNNQQATNKQTDNCGFDTQTNQPNNQTPNQKPSGLLTIIGQLLPLAPFAFEQFTGQKVPQMTGTMAEMQRALINIQSNLQVIVQNQHNLDKRLIQLETNANQQLTNLTNQFKSLRLTHTKEQKQIEYNPDKSLESPEY